MKKFNSILIIFVIIVILIITLVILYFIFFISHQGEVNLNTTPTNTNVPPVVAPIDLITFETPTLTMDNFLIKYPPYITDKYRSELYKCIGLNDIKVCDESQSLLPFEDVKNTKVPFVSTSYSESCRNQSNLKQYLMTGTKENLDNITTVNARKTAQAIKENNSALCPGLEYPTCMLAFHMSCIDKSFLEKDDPLNVQMRKNILEYLTYINPQLVAGYDENDNVDKAYVLKAYDLYGQYLCDLLFKMTTIEPQVAKGTLTTEFCNQFDKDKNLLERWAYLRCMNFAQNKTNYCLDELKRFGNK